MYRERIKSILKTMVPCLRRTDLTLGSSPELDAINFGPRRFRYAELRVATNNFSNENLLGRGGFGFVYKGAILVESENETVAIKKMAKHSKQGEREFLAEVLSVGRVRHRNLAPLLGWCHERDEVLLVYEFMANGSLDQHLHGGSNPTLPWSSRFEILQGIASALEYLHGGWEKCILHRDIKPSNVLLDSHMTARLGDFGLARLAGHSARLSTAAAGTLGYMAPEVFLYGEVTKKADVYSFGVVALEVVCARRPPGFHSENDDAENLVEWVWSAYERGELLAVVDPILREVAESQQVTWVLHLGMLCTLLDPSLRPPTTRLMQALRGDWSVCVPASRWDSGGATRPWIREINVDIAAECRRYSYAELMDATENWKLYLGRGSYGNVYRGSMILDPENENCEVHNVAIMKLTPNWRGEEFHVEVLSVIGRLRHRNVVPLLGWCYEHDELFVVYEFMENGSLDIHLHPTDSNAAILPWPSRFKILQELVVAMDYVHSGCQERWILHRQIKLSAVMLDKQMTAKQADFGLSLIAQCELGEENFSYMAPELISGGNEAATVKSDVYSFGLMALELVCGRPSITGDVRGEKNLKWVWDMHKRGQLLDVINATLGGAFFKRKDTQEDSFDLDGLMKQQIIRVLQLGKMCCLPKASFRPHNNQLLPALHGDWSLFQLACVKENGLQNLGTYMTRVVLFDDLTKCSTPP